MFPLFDHRKFVFYLSLGIAAVLISSQITSIFNPYGIILSYLGAVVFVAAFSHKWVKAGSYMILTAVSTGVIVVSICLNNCLGEYYEDTFLDDVKDFLFFLSVFLCPFGIVIGLVGSFLHLDKRKISKS
jgi:purine-cytosine permease-like protein